MLALTLLLSGVVALSPPTPSSAGPLVKPNIIFFLTDDQTLEAIGHNPTAMPYLRARLDDPNDHWTTFDQAFLNTPICCPTRATLFTGLSSHHTGVETNGQGAVLREFESSTIATWLHTAGYYTGLVGKYINKYPFGGPFYTPPGWDRWVANFNDYYNYTNDEDGTLVRYGSDPADYSTDVLARKAVDFIATAPTDRPFFLFAAPKAGHDPYTPAPRHVDAFAGMQPTRRPDFNEADVSDKPTWVQHLGRMGPELIRQQDLDRQHQFESLLAADDAVRDIFDALEARGELDHTVFIFMSDNGFAFGEHRWKTKKCEYEECTRTPLLIRYPGVEARVDHSLVSSIDVAPTLAALAGIQPASCVDGRSLVPLVLQRRISWRREVLLHTIDDAYPMPGYWGIHTKAYLYVEFTNGEKELYDLKGVLSRADPYELANRVRDPAYAAVEAHLASRLLRLKAAGCS
jgi:arylsulfatase A-like enzyme